MELSVDETSGRIYASLSDVGQVCAIDPHAGSVTCASGLGRPYSIAAGADSVYVADVAGQRIVVLDLVTCGIMRVRQLPAAPHALTLDADRDRLFVAQMGLGKIVSLATDDLTVTAEARLGGLGYPTDMALDANHKRLYIVHSLSAKYGAVTAIDAADLSRPTTRWGNREESLLGVSAVGIDADGDQVYVKHSSGITAVDPKTLSTLRRVAFGPPSWPGAMAFDPLEATIYLSGGGGKLWTWRAIPSAKGTRHERRR